MTSKDDRARRWVEGLQEAEADPNPLALVEFWCQWRKVSEDDLRAAVAAARAAGCSWTEIGDVLGVRRQSAWERYGP